MRYLTLLIVLLLGCTHQQAREVFYPEAERAYCQRAPESAICMGYAQTSSPVEPETEYCAQGPDSRECVQYFRRIADALLKKFYYQRDEKTYGKKEYWHALRLEKEYLVGDCEDCVITLANALVIAGLPLDNISVYLMKTDFSPNHIALRYGRYFVDCSNKEISTSLPFYHLLSRRKITSKKWEYYRRMPDVNLTHQRF